MADALTLCFATQAPPTPEELSALAPTARLLAAAGEGGAIALAWREVRVTFVPVLGATRRDQLAALERALSGKGPRFGPATELWKVTIAPEWDPEGKAENLLEAVARATDALVVQGPELLDARGQTLAKLSAPLDALGRTGRPPEAVAARALVLAAVGLRGLLEVPGQPEPDSVREQLAQLFTREELDAALEPEERRWLDTPVGALDEAEALLAAWQTESAGMLAWALGQFELPPGDLQVDPLELADALGLRPGSPLALLAAPALRREPELTTAAADVKALLDRLEHADPTLEVGGVPLGEADPTWVALTGSIASARRRALQWLLGPDRSWTELAYQAGGPRDVER